MSSPTVPERKPSTFLSLAPATSSSYPQQQPKAVAKTVPLTPSALAEVPEDSAQLKARTSSMSSDGNKSASGFRFLKLGPVHWGEHGGDHKSDWHDAAVE